MIAVSAALMRGPARRRVPWAVLGATGAMGLALVAWRAAESDATSELIQPFRLLAILLASAGAGCLEDGAEALGATTPFGRARRRALAVAMTAAVIVAEWLLAVCLVAIIATPTRGSADSGLPLAGMFLELVTLCLIGWMLGSATIVTWGWRGSSTRAALGVLFVAIFSVAHPSFITWLWAGPGEPGWAAAHTHWALVGLAALFIFGALSRDPAAPPVIPQRRLPSR